MADAAKTPRPEFRNIGLKDILFSYRLPLAGRTSIGHRISGGLLFVCLPLLLYLFDKSLTSEFSFDEARQIFSCVYVKIGVLVLAWAFAFHLCAGIRHLLMDINHGFVTKQHGKVTSVIVFVVAALVTLAVAAKLFGNF
jgi:succinate dehydrogenase / fumarate reductase cytochrome b subunit